jgi:protein involved in polysaccharide export with SLBB domain
MKTKYLASFLLTLFSLQFSAQEFDETFLKSLPADIASDLIERTNQKEIAEQPVYRRSSTFVDKPKFNNIKSNRFGINIFSMMQTSFMPINEPNLDDSYILDFGDEIEIQLIGSESSVTKHLIKRDGSINIKDIGKIFISGLSINNASSLIKTKINQSYIGVEAFISLTNIRDIQVIIAGDVYNPGPYSINGNSNIFNALSIAGGPTEMGSFRKINLVRDNQKIESIDLYDTFIHGRSVLKTRLRSGDIIFVQPVQNLITVSGAVKRPGVYELNENQTLDDALLYANGLTSFSDNENIKLDRVLDKKISSIKIQNISQFKNIKNNDSDRIFIRKIPFRNVTIQGAVTNPGIYLMNEGDTIQDVVIKAGGYTPNAYSYGGIYENVNAKAINKAAVEKLYFDLLDNLIKLSQEAMISNIDMTPVIALANQLKNSEPNGRIVTSFELDEEYIDNITYVEEGDVITIPEKTNQIFLYGAIKSDGAVAYKEKAKIDFYINQKGGFLDDADLDNIYVMHPNGITKSIAINKNIFTRQVLNEELYPGSVIYIPRKLDDTITSRLSTQAYASILANIGLTIASIASINKN